MGLFGRREKKTCAICGKELGLFGKTKLEDGYLCKDCAGRLSPFFEDARRSTVDQVKQQLEYREANEAILKTFSPTRELGGTWRVLIDDNKGGIVITNQRDWKAANPDVINFADVKGCDVRVDENRRELYREDKEGHRQSYSPPRYEYSYDFWVTIRVSNPYFSTIKFKLNDWSVERRPSAEYDRYEQDANEIRNALISLGVSAQQQYRQGGYQQQAPQQSRHQASYQQPASCQQPASYQQPTSYQQPIQPIYQQAASRVANSQQLIYQQQVTQAAQQQSAQPAQQAVAQATPRAFCPNCGAPVTPGARFCESCGSALS